jgi:hypothetical protein
LLLEDGNPPLDLPEMRIYHQAKAIQESLQNCLAKKGGQSKLTTFDTQYGDVCRWIEPVRRNVHALEPAEHKTSESVRNEMSGILEWLQQTYTLEADLPMVRNVSSYTKGFWRGLFTCYNHSFLPRTNNDHERFYRQTKTRHRRMTGRRSWNEYILRNGEYIVLVDDALKQQDLSNRLGLVPYERYKVQRAQWNARLTESVLRRRFRRNPENYLKQLEEKFCMLVIPS